MPTLRVVVLVSGTGTLLRALLTACADPNYGVTVTAVGADRSDAPALRAARAAGVETFACAVEDYPNRLAWDTELTRLVGRHQPDLVISAGFLKLVGAPFLREFAGRFINTHPSLLPAFPGMHAVGDALAYGVRVTGCTVFFVDGGVDSGPIIDQRVVPVLPADTEDILHERIKVVERAMLADVVGRMSRLGWTVLGRRVVLG